MIRPIISGTTQSTTTVSTKRNRGRRRFVLLCFTMCRLLHGRLNNISDNCDELDVIAAQLTATATHNNHSIAIVMVINRQRIMYTFCHTGCNVSGSIDYAQLEHTALMYHSHPATAGDNRVGCKQHGCGHSRLDCIICVPLNDDQSHSQAAAASCCTYCCQAHLLDSSMLIAVEFH